MITESSDVAIAFMSAGESGTNAKIQFDEC